MEGVPIHAASPQVTAGPSGNRGAASGYRGAASGKTPRGGESRFNPSRRHLAAVPPPSRRRPATTRANTGAGGERRPPRRPGDGPRRRSRPVFVLWSVVTRRYFRGRSNTVEYKEVAAGLGAPPDQRPWRAWDNYNKSRGPLGSLRVTRVTGSLHLVRPEAVGGSRSAVHPRQRLNRTGRDAAV